MATENRVLLLTNDDGVDAPGLKALREATEGLGLRKVVAPQLHSSGCSHAVTISGPIRIHRRSDDETAVDGSPADCVRIALTRLQPNFDWVISGINEGGNLGGDVFHSGTVAAVREAVLHGRPGIAISHYKARGKTIDWRLAAKWAARVLGDLIETSWEPGTFWNVNLPHPGPEILEPEVVFCGLDPSPLPLDFRFDEEGKIAHYCGDYQGRERIPGADIDLCFGGRIAVSLIRVH